MVALLYTRRVSGAITALSTAPWEDAPIVWRAVFGRIAAAAQTTLDSLAASLEHGRKPDPLPNFGVMLLPSEHEMAHALPDDHTAIERSLFRTHVYRLVRQLRILHDAIQRMQQPNAG
jgi:hypothetical protein